MKRPAFRETRKAYSTDAEFPKSPIRNRFNRTSRLPGKVGKSPARFELEARTGKRVGSPLNAKDATMMHLPDHGQEDSHEY